MKKIVLLAALAMSTVAFAQKGTKSVGAQLVYGTEIENVGIGIKGNYAYTDNIRFAADINKYFKKHNWSMWDMNANVQYAINLGDKFKVYPFIGLAWTNWVITFEKEKSGKIYVEDERKVRFGANFGAGVEFNLTPNAFVSLEAKHQVVSTYDQTVYALGIGYRF